MLKTIFLAGVLLMVATSCETEFSQEIAEVGKPSRGSTGSVDFIFPDAGVFDAGAPDLLSDGLAKDALVHADVAGPEVAQMPDLGAEAREIPDLGISKDTVPSLPDVIASYPDAGKEAAMACPTSCFQGCYNGCGANGQCKSCATCTCEVVTGICHC